VSAATAVVAAPARAGTSRVHDAERLLLDQVVRHVAWDTPEALLEHEWLVTNGLGGYASGTLADVVTRRYHGVLVAALPEPHGRMVVCNQLAVRCVLADGTEVALGGQEQTGDRLDLAGAHALRAFRLEAGLPVWEYALPDGSTLERRLVMPHGQNTVVQRWARRGGASPARLELRPALHFRGYEDPVTAPDDARYALAVDGDHFVVPASPRRCRRCASPCTAPTCSACSSRRSSASCTTAWRRRAATRPPARSGHRAPSPSRYPVTASRRSW
jgi:hypothetical protein